MNKYQLALERYKCVCNYHKCVLTADMLAVETLQELVDKEEYFKWHKFPEDEHEKLYGYEGDFPEDGKWVLVCDRNGKHHIARFKFDAINHFYPSTTVELEDSIVWRYVDWFDLSKFKKERKNND